jgi:hypothetical protein
LSPIRCALPVFLILATAPPAALAESVCHVIRRGESAAQVARRLTGDGRNAYRPWFELKNASSRSVPKSQYNRIRAGWVACVSKAAIRTSSPYDQRAAALEAPLTLRGSQSSQLSEAPAESAIRSTSAAVKDGDGSPQPGAFDVVGAIGSLDLTMVWLGTAMVVPLVGWRILDGYFIRRKTASIVVRHFAHRFVTEFERPLICNEGEAPIRSRLRCSARLGRFDILLAPGKGRRYPNLSDHKKNLEYDVARVLHVLADESFVCGRPYAQAGWVVVPLQFLLHGSRKRGGSAPTHVRTFGASPGQEQSGVTCISSF